MNLQLKTNHLEIIKNHAEKTYPDECCGLILGYIDSEYKIVVEIIPTENVWNREKSNFTENQEEYSTRSRYAIAPQVMLQTQKEARNRNLNIIGIYHSHPDYPAVPSEWDRIYAWPEYSYVILSVQNTQAGELQSWTLDENHQFQAETIELIKLANLS
ncbi:M67 family metallopeptidase [Anabaena sp. UHCC 0187]|uniref:Mov34/MPN/PAD-1 family protein n=1 Tax=Anabaena sp. UHCC 0187 TaxID=2590018 RepID=UPI001445ACCE|nr:M67 family metallopeptidase [Anabaena sp. UHCC 0187]MTJ12046.1 M67 family metallopeptidase [Anabaena sp. UHCC 0187]